MKLSWIKINEGLMNILLVSSDPLGSSTRGWFPLKKVQAFSEDAKNLIKFEKNIVPCASDTWISLSVTESESHCDLEWGFFFF